MWPREFAGAARDRLIGSEPGGTQKGLLVVGLVVALVAVLTGAGVALVRHEASDPVGLPQASSRPPPRASSKPPPAPAQMSLRGARLTVGSKDFDEQIILGQIAELMLEQAGAEVTDRTGLSSTTATRQALESGEIDLYWEYTGIGLTTHLGKGANSPGEVGTYNIVAADDLAENGIKWLAPFAPGNNTYTLAIRSEAAASLNVRSLSDLPRLAANPSNLTICVEKEFADRFSGLPSLLETYDIPVPEENIKTMEVGAVYTATDKGTRCNFGEVFTTDGRVQSLGLTPLTDDMLWAPAYNPAVTMRIST